MSHEDVLNAARWATPPYYAGFDPVGDFCILSKLRDADTVSRSNWEVALEMLKKQEAKEVLRQPFQAAVYTWRARCSMAGHIDYLMVRADAPETIKRLAAIMLSSLQAYPILDDEHHSNLEYEETLQYWRDMSLNERLTVLQQCEAQVSLFSIRRDDMPDDEQGRVYNWLRD
jgi:hypothetical protein